MIYASRPAVLSQQLAGYVRADTSTSNGWRPGTVRGLGGLSPMQRVRARRRLGLGDDPAMQQGATYVFTFVTDSYLMGRSGESVAATIRAQDARYANPTVQLNSVAFSESASMTVGFTWQGQDSPSIAAAGQQLALIMNSMIGINFQFQSGAPVGGAAAGVTQSSPGASARGGYQSPNLAPGPSPSSDMTSWIQNNWKWVAIGGAALFAMKDLL